MSESRSTTVEPIPAKILNVGELPKSGVDACGRILPMSEDERKAHFERVRRALEKLDAMPADETETDEIWAAVMRGIDEGRPERKLFEGRY